MTSHAKASSAGSPSRRMRLSLFGLGLLCAALALLAFSAAQASAARTYHSQLTQANGTAFTNPWGLAVDNSNNLWVFDQGAHTLSQFDSSGAYLAQNDGTGSWNGSPYVQGLAYAKTADLLYAADSNADDLWGIKASDASYSSTDLFGGAWDSGPHNGCCYIKDAVDNSGTATDGDLYVTNGTNVTRVDNSGAAADFSASQSYISANQLTGTPAHSFGSAGAIATDSAGNVYVADNGNGEVDEFDSTGTFVRAFTGSFGSISSLAVDPTNGNVLIGDSGQGVVHEFDSTGTFVADIDGTATPAGSMTPQGLAVDSTGTLYVSDSAHAVVDVFGPATPPPTYHSQLTQANGTAFTNPWGLAVDNSNNLWVFDQGAHTLSQFDSSGAYLAQNDGTGSWNGSPYVQGLAYAKTADLLYAADSNSDDLWGIKASDASYANVDLKDGVDTGCCYIFDAVDNSATATDGDLYVTNGSVLTRVDNSGAAANFSASQSYISANQLTGTPAHSFGNTSAVATDTAGNVYVADNGNAEVDEFDSTGTFVRAFSGSFGTISALAVDPTNGNVFIGDSGQGVVHEFDSTANFIADIDGSGTPDSSFTPQGLAVDSTGRLYVADAAHAVVDVFAPGGAPPPTHTLSVSAAGLGAGTVTSSPAGIDCGATCSHGFNDNSTATLTAHPDANSTFTGWTVDGDANACPGTGTCDVPIGTTDHAVIASFGQAHRSLTVTPTSAGSGSVTADSGAIAGCAINPSGGTCTDSYVKGSVVHLTATATPATHTALGAWSGCDSVNGAGDQCTVTVNSDTNVGVSFDQIHHALSVHHAGAGSASVAADSGAISGCSPDGGGTCADGYVEGATVHLTATPFAHSALDHWSGCDSVNVAGDQCTVTVNSDTDVTLSTDLITHSLTLTATGNGSVDADSGLIATCSASGGICADTYIEDTPVTLTATPGAHSMVSWSGCDSVLANQCLLIVAADSNPTATFSPITHTLTVHRTGTGAGSVSCDGGACAASYPEGASVTLGATADSGSTFAGFSGAGCSGAGPCTVTLSADTTVSAQFDANPPPPNCATDPSLCPKHPPEPLTCKKGFKKAIVHGKQVCVKVKRHRHHRRGGSK